MLHTNIVAPFLRKRTDIGCGCPWTCYTTEEANDRSLGIVDGSHFSPPQYPHPNDLKELTGISDITAPDLPPHHINHASLEPQLMQL
jgi:hypothetical protein